MGERFVELDEVQIWCEDFGAPDDPAVLLIMGAGGQAIIWPEDFCQGLAAGGRYVIRYDNRDTGQSSSVDFGINPYDVAALARDAIGVLDAHGIDRAHIVGASMGGMIAQAIAIDHQQRVRSLVSIMSTPLGRGFMALMNGESGALPGPARRVTEALKTFASKIPQNDEERAEMTVAIARAIASGADPFDEVAVRALDTRLRARERNPGAATNHMLAVAASPDRTEALARIAAPTLVVHGNDDLSVPLEHGRATAAAIPGAELFVIEGMGHAIPIFARQRLVEAILTHTAAAG